jgi:hypothetical protein
VAAIDVRGGGPGTREGALLDLANTVERIDAIALAGGSAFGLEAGGGVQAWLAEQGRGFAVRGAVIPIVPGAICSISSTAATRPGAASRPTAISAYAAAPRQPRISRSAAPAPGSAHHREFQGRPRLGFGGDARRRDGRRTRGGQCGRHRDGRRRAVVLGRAV